MNYRQLISYSSLWLYLSLFLMQSFCSAGFLPRFEGNKLGFVSLGLSKMLLPNEVIPGEARKILAEAPSGVYLGVGTERTLIDAGNTRRATHILQVDRDPEVVLYNRVNVALLKVASTREEYLYLRYVAVSSHWEMKSELPSLSPQERDFFKSFAIFTWFRGVVKEDCFYWKNRKSSDKHRLFFNGPDYISNDEFFERIRNLALKGHIQSILGDLNHFEFVLEIINEMTDQGLFFSVFDLSNAWQEKYLGIETTKKILKAVQNRMMSDSLLLVTIRSTLLVSLESWFVCKNIFRYYAATLLELDSSSGFFDFLWERDNSAPPLHSGRARKSDDEIRSASEIKEELFLLKDSALLNPHVAFEFSWDVLK